MAEKKNKPNNGALFPNEKQREGKNDPDMQGQFTDAKGNEFWVSAWKHKKGDLKYLSFEMKPKESGEATTKETTKKPRLDSWGDPIPD